MTSWDRYRNDPVFHRLVAVLCQAVETGAVTEADIVEGAELAARIVENRVARGHQLPPAPYYGGLPPGTVRPPIEERLRASWTPIGHVGGNRSDDLTFRTVDHPNANGRQRAIGEVCYQLIVRLEDGRQLAIDFGTVTRGTIERVLLDFAFADEGPSTE